MRPATLIGLALLSTFSNAHAWPYNLVQDMGVSGVKRLCKYSNGKVYAVNATDLCSLSIEDSAPGFGQGTGHLQGEYLDGMTKVCVYDVMGERRGLRLNSTSLCPLSPKF